MTGALLRMFMSVPAVMVGVIAAVLAIFADVAEARRLQADIGLQCFQQQL